MDNQNMARILQNMIDEAEENLTTLAASMHGYESLVGLNKRRADLAEAVKLVEELGQPALVEQGEGLGILNECLAWLEYDSTYVESQSKAPLDSLGLRAESMAKLRRYIASRPQPEAAVKRREVIVEHGDNRHEEGGNKISEHPDWYVSPRQLASRVIDAYEAIPRSLNACKERADAIELLIVDWLPCALIAKEDRWPPAQVASTACAVDALPQPEAAKVVPMDSQIDFIRGRLKRAYEWGEANTIPVKGDDFKHTRFEAWLKTTVNEYRNLSTILQLKEKALPLRMLMAIAADHLSGGLKDSEIAITVTKIVADYGYTAKE